MPCSEKYYRLKGAGRCVNCERQLVPEEGVRCADCVEKKREARRRLESRRLVSSKCRACGTGVPDGQRQCSACRKKDNEVTRKKQKRRIESGICVRCASAPSAPDSIRCVSCLEEAKRRGVERRADAMARGVCFRCGEAKPAGSENLHCPACKKEIHDRYWKVHTDRLSEGMCTSCGRHPFRPGFVTCEACAMQVRNREAERRRSLKDSGRCVVCASGMTVSDYARSESTCTGCLDRRKDYIDRLKSDRLKAGLCIVCGANPPRPDRLQCESCAEKAKKYYSTVFETRAAAGLCVRCGEVEVDDPMSGPCEACVEKKAVDIRKTRAWRKANGVCWWCGVEPSLAPGAKCAECERKHNKDTRKQWLLDNNLCTQCEANAPIEGLKYCAECKKQKHDSYIEARDKALAEGVCYYCKAPAEKGCKRCSDCAAEHNERFRRRRAKLFAEGICYRCGKQPIVEGFTKCEGCRKKDTERSYRYKSNPRTRDAPALQA